VDSSAHSASATARAPQTYPQPEWRRRKEAPTHLPTNPFSVGVGGKRMRRTSCKCNFGCNFLSPSLERTNTSSAQLICSVPPSVLNLVTLAWPGWAGERKKKSGFRDECAKFTTYFIVRMLLPTESKCAKSAVDYDDAGIYCVL
jgi:hypothetical protein